MPDPEAEPTHWFYRFSVWFTRLLLNIFSRWVLTGREHVPLRGPLLVVSNHLNNVDPPLMVGLMPRVVHCMAKQEMFVGPVGALSRWYGAFPVRRGEADRQAIRTALDYLRRGSCVGIFPEGTRSRTGALIQAHTGVGLLALRSGAQIVPIAIQGTDEVGSFWSLLKRPEISITIGQPFSLEPHQGAGMSSAAAAATELIMRRIAALLPPSRRGVYADAEAASAQRQEP